MEIDKSNKELWDIDVSKHPFYEITYYLNLKRIDRINKKLDKEGKDVRAAYSTLSSFVYTLNIHPGLFQEEKEKALVILRRNKIEKITKKL